MEMNDILNGLNSCDDDCSDSMSNNYSCGPSFGGPGIGGFPGGMGGFGQGQCNGGFGSWIWILLILFYCGCGRNNYGRGMNNCCECCCEKKECCCEKKNDCCCNQGNNGRGSGFLNNCSPYLFILVILFLCNNSFAGNGLNNCFGCGQGFGGGISPFNNGCATTC